MSLAAHNESTSCAIPPLPESERTLSRWFEASALQAPAPFTFGNAPGTRLTGPGLANVDLSLIKNFAIKERFGFQFRAEAFNTFNRVNLEDPGRAFGSPQFGVVSATRDARSIQLGMKLTFSDLLTYQFGQWTDGCQTVLGASTGDAVDRDWHALKATSF